MSDNKTESEIDQLEKAINEHFGEQTLEALRQDAQAQPCGAICTAFGLEGEGSLFVVACFATPEAVHRVCDAYNLPDSCPYHSWENILVVDALCDAAETEDGLGFVGLGDAANHLIAVAVLATKQTSVSRLSKFLNISD